MKNDNRYIISTIKKFSSLKNMKKIFKRVDTNIKKNGSHIG